MTAPLNDYTAQIERIRTDVRCGGKIGMASALRLLDVVNQLASEVRNLRNRISELEG